MIARGANVNARDEMGTTVLMRASSMGNSKVMSFVLEHGATINAQSIDGRTALHYAVIDESVASVTMLLKYHALVNLRDKVGKTPLWQWSHQIHKLSSGPPEILHLLKAAGATE